MARTKYKNDPRYKKYFTLLRVGVREKDVMDKLRQDGFDPAVLADEGNGYSSWDEAHAQAAEEQVEKDSMDGSDSSF